MVEQFSYSRKQQQLIYVYIYIYIYIAEDSKFQNRQYTQKSIQL